MQKIINLISYPRSGCQILALTLFKYFSNNIHYPYNKYTPPSNEFTKSQSLLDLIRESNENYIHINNLIYTSKELYDSYQLQIENLNAKYILIQSHDYGEDIKENEKYIFLYRHPLKAIISFYNYGENKKHYYDFEEFFDKEYIYWKYHTLKYLYNSLSIKYLEISNNSLLVIKNLLKYMGVNKIDMELLSKIIKYYPIKSDISVNKYKEYNNIELLKNLEKKYYQI